MEKKRNVYSVLIGVSTLLMIFIFCLLIDKIYQNEEKIEFLMNRVAEGVIFPEAVADARGAAVTITADGQRGSGAIITESGYILTASHVIEGVEEITVMLNSTEEEFTTKNKTLSLIGWTNHDLALLKINKDQKFSFVSLADSDTVEVGAPIFTVGTPGAGALTLEGSVTAGIVSYRYRHRNMTEFSPGISSDITTPKFRIDAAINPGNSGGALLNTKGELIGIVVSKSYYRKDESTDTVRALEGVADAVTSNTAKSFLASICPEDFSEVQ